MNLADYTAKVLRATRTGTPARTLTDVAKALGTTRATLSRYESCQRHPTLDFLHDWAQELDTNLSDIIRRYERTEDHR